MTAPGSGNDVRSPRRVEEDLGYVRDVVSRSERDDTPRAIWYLWAAIGGIGFALIDFRPERVGLFWSVAAPLGFLASVWLGWRHGRALGQESRREGRAHMLHWGGMGGTTLLLVSHDPEAVRQNCRRCIWLEGGRLRADGQPDEVLGLYAESEEAAVQPDRDGATVSA